jgi:hypothetical protein
MPVNPAADSSSGTITTIVKHARATALLHQYVESDRPVG